MRLDFSFHGIFGRSGPGEFFKKGGKLFLQLIRAELFSLLFLFLFFLFVFFFFFENVSNMSRRSFSSSVCNIFVLFFRTKSCQFVNWVSFYNSGKIEDYFFFVQCYVFLSSDQLSFHSILIWVFFSLGFLIYQKQNFLRKRGFLIFIGLIPHILPAFKNTKKNQTFSSKLVHSIFFKFIIFC